MTPYKFLTSVYKTLTMPLPLGMILGTTIYFIFSSVEALEPVGVEFGPYLVDTIPYVISVMLYITFCKIKMSDMRPRTWHFILQGVRILLSGSFVVAIMLTEDANMKLLLEGLFVCVICPTAAAAPVITEKLGGSIESMTIYTLIANVVTSVIIPLSFPLVNPDTTITFAAAASQIWGRVLFVLILPLCLALLTRKYLPKLASAMKRIGNVPFYLWAFNLSVLCGLTACRIVHSPLNGWELALMILLPAVVTIMLFSIGKGVGRHYGDSISAGQALGQKNTTVGIWLTTEFLDPFAVIAPGAYIIWQNIVNSWQLWYKQKHGYLKW